MIQDYGFRLYNPSIAKFLSVDPLTKEYPTLTPYQFASNTPIAAIDLDGLEAYIPRFGNRLEDLDGDGEITDNEKLVSRQFAFGLGAAAAAVFTGGVLSPLLTEVVVSSPVLVTTTATTLTYIAQNPGLANDLGAFALALAGYDGEIANASGDDVGRLLNKGLGKVGNRLSKINFSGVPKLITNKIPHFQTGHVMNSVIENGNLIIEGDKSYTGTVNFIINKSGELVTGIGHSHLADGEDVLGAGTFLFKDGKLKAVSNTSGHYEPTVQEAEQAYKLLQDMGINLDDVFNHTLKSFDDGTYEILEKTWEKELND